MHEFPQKFKPFGFDPALLPRVMEQRPGHPLYTFCEEFCRLNFFINAMVTKLLSRTFIEKLKLKEKVVDF
jgi:hypothetical protein